MRVRMGAADRKTGFCVAFLVLILLNIHCCGAASLEVNTTTSWCNGFVDECLTMDLEFDLFMGSEIGRMLAPGNDPPVTQGTANPHKQAVTGTGVPYGNNVPQQNGKVEKCDPRKRDCKTIYKH